MNDPSPPPIQDTLLVERLGQITRQLHDAMKELGFDAQLQRIAQEIPDARDRLSYVGRMTENAAHKVLGLVDDARPRCNHLVENAEGHQRDLDRLLADSAASAADLREGLRRAQAFADATATAVAEQDQVLSSIMLAQDFQDLSGQVIKKVVDIISRTESQLAQLVAQSTTEAAEPAPAAAEAALQGPQVPDKALKQDDVDALLASMDF